MNFFKCVTVASELHRMYFRFSPVSSADLEGLIAVAAVVVDVEEEGTGGGIQWKNVSLNSDLKIA